MALGGFCFIAMDNELEQAMVLNATNGNILFADAISKEMENVKVVFEILPDKEKNP